MSKKGKTSPSKAEVDALFERWMEDAPSDHQVRMNSPQALANISRSSKNARAAETVRKRFSDAQKIAQNRPDVAKRKSIALKSTLAKPEVRRRKSESIKKALTAPETRSKISKGVSKALQQQELKNRLSNLAKARCEDPEFIRKLSNAQLDNDVRQRKSDKMKEFANRPEIRQARAKTMGMKVACPFCNKEGGQIIMKRYHFDNCKHKP